MKININIDDRAHILSKYIPSTHLVQSLKFALVFSVIKIVLLFSE